MKKINLLISLFFVAFTAFASDIGSVQGVIKDDITGLPIEGATVAFAAFKTSTDENGAFEISQIPVGTYKALIEKLGYETKSLPLSIDPDEKEIMRIELKIKAFNLQEVLIKADRATSAASSLILNALDFQLRNINSAQDMLRNVPGLVTAQHAGGGKAEQIFLRGFDADHGTDVAAYVDGMPVNMSSHGHGQGYLDMHFLIPEMAAGILM